MMAPSPKERWGWAEHHFQGCAGRKIRREVAEQSGRGSVGGGRPTVGKNRKGFGYHVRLTRARSSNTSIREGFEVRRGGARIPREHGGGNVAGRPFKGLGDCRAVSFLSLPCFLFLLFLLPCSSTRQESGHVCIPGGHSTTTASLYGSRHSDLDSPTHLRGTPNSPTHTKRRARGEGERGALLWRRGPVGCYGRASDWDWIGRVCEIMPLPFESKI